MGAELTYAAMRLWAKKERNGEQYWLPLIMHMEDSVAVARYIWQNWLGQGAKQTIAQCCGCDEEVAGMLFVFIMAVHDIGKATPLFQSKNSGFRASDMDERITEELIGAGLYVKPYEKYYQYKLSPHALAGQIWLESKGCKRSIAAIIGAHHGKTPTNTDYKNGKIECCEDNFYASIEYKENWENVRQEILEYALKLSGFTSLENMPDVDVAAQVAFSGLAIMADWIASSEEFFPYISIDEAMQIGEGRARLNNAKGKLEFLKTAWQSENWQITPETFIDRFGFAPRVLQQSVAQTAEGIAEPGIFVLEAPMGVGKTEAALAAAEIFAAVCGRSGLFFALPTQATSNGMFSRLVNWVNVLDGGRHSMELVHSNAQFNDDFKKLNRIRSNNIDVDDDAGAAVYQWFEGRKKSMLADFVVGTVDQLLQLALKQKHVMLRHVALMNKVVIIDECHAYDAYMNVYLKRALNWLGRYKVTVILLSATLPAAKRDDLVRAYLNRDAATSRRRRRDIQNEEANSDYPLMTYTDGDNVLQKHVEAGVMPLNVKVNRIYENDVVDLLEDLLSDGGCAAIIVNTVKHAQELAERLKAEFGDDVSLLHSRFTATDRISKEDILRKQLGKAGTGTMRPHRLIVVGTQVIEQSLDIDFDVMISELCPIDLLLQRMGRLHRHNRNRPDKLKKAQCFVLKCEDENIDKGSAAVYGEYMLMRTEAVLPDEINIPDDVSRLVQTVYGEDDGVMQHSLEQYAKAKEEWISETRNKETRAEAFRITKPWPGMGYNIIGWLDVAMTDSQGEATVRDTDESFDVIMVKQNSDGTLSLLSNGLALLTTTPDDTTAKLIARESIRMPRELCVPYRIDKAIEYIEKQASEIVSKWQASPWLKGSLVLMLNEQNEASILGYKLKYDSFYGLTCTKEDEANE